MLPSRELILKAAASSTCKQLQVGPAADRARALCEGSAALERYKQLFLTLVHTLTGLLQISANLWLPDESCRAIYVVRKDSCKAERALTSQRALWALE